MDQSLRKGQERLCGRIGIVVLSRALVGSDVGNWICGVCAKQWPVCLESFLFYLVAAAEARWMFDFVATSYECIRR